MTKSDIVDIIAASTGISKIETEAVVKGFLETVIASLSKGETIELRGFGTFKTVRRAPRIARNPKTNQEVTVPAQVVPVLKVSKEFRAVVQKSLS